MLILKTSVEVYFEYISSWIFLVGYNNRRELSTLSGAITIVKKASN